MVTQNHVLIIIMSQQIEHAGEVERSLPFFNQHPRHEWFNWGPPAFIKMSVCHQMRNDRSCCQYSHFRNEFCRASVCQHHGSRIIHNILHRTSRVDVWRCSQNSVQCSPHHGHPAIATSLFDTRREHLCLLTTGINHQHSSSTENRADLLRKTCRSTKSLRTKPIQL